MTTTAWPGQRRAGTVLAAVLFGSLPGALPAADHDGTRAFTKIANDGSDLAPTARHGPAPGDWACSRDDRTGLVWEIKTRDGGLRDLQWTYTPYDGNPATNGGYPGYRDAQSGQCRRELMRGGSCNTEAYIQAVNDARLCGFSDWRLPAVSELVRVSAETTEDASARTSRMLPNIASGWYWTGIERVGITQFSRVILLPPAARPAFYDGSYLVLAVRGAGTARR